MSSNAQRFAETVLDAFRDAGLHTDVEVGRAGGPSTTTMTKLRKAAAGEVISEPRGDMLRKIDAAAGWSAGAARALWHTGELPPRHAVRPAAPAPAMGISEVAVRAERDDFGNFVGRLVSTAKLSDGTSRLEVRYHPGPGRAIAAGDLVAALAGVHSKVLDATYLEGGGDGNAENRHPRGPASTKPAMYSFDEDDVAARDEDNEKPRLSDD